MGVSLLGTRTNRVWTLWVLKGGEIFFFFFTVWRGVFIGKVGAPLNWFEGFLNSIFGLKICVWVGGTFRRNIFGKFLGNYQRGGPPWCSHSGKQRHGHDVLRKKTPPSANIFSSVGRKTKFGVVRVVTTPQQPILA